MKKPSLIHSWLLNIMRLTLIQFFLAFLFAGVSLAYESNAQALLEQKITLQLQNQKVSRILNQIEKKTNIRFVFSSALIGSDRKASLIAKDIPLSDVLDQLLAPLQVTYEVSGKVIILHRIKADKTQSLSPEEPGAATEFNVSGKVTDDKGEPIPGVNIVLKGTSTGASTDVSGNYTLSLPDASVNGTLIFSYIGFVTQEIAISNQTTIDVKLVSDVKALSEVVVVGYGTQKRSDITGSVTSVPKDRLANLPVTNVLQAIQGSIAGVNISQTSTVPGSTGTSIQVRGVRSLTANNNPYIILDGVPFPGTFNDINPNDIESMEVLKDASATAIYGTRGSNGVILIQTKRGKAGKPVIRYNAYAGPEYMTNRLELLDGPGYAAKYATYIFQRTGTQPPNPILPNYSEVPNYQAGKQVDWLKEIGQQGSIQSHNVSISGGTQDVRYYLSGEYLKQAGILQGYQYQRIGIRSNLDADVTKWLTLGTSLFLANNNDGGGRVNLAYAMAMSPYGNVNDAKGNYEIYPMYPETLYSNPLLGLNSFRESRSKNLTGTFYGEVKPTFAKGLKYRLNGNYSYLIGKGNTYSGRASNDLLGTASLNNYETSNWTVENILSYTKDINAHHFDLTALYSAQETQKYDNGSSANTFINDELDIYNIAAGQIIRSIGSSYRRQSLESQMVRLNYSFASKYLFTATARRDGSSVFGNETDKYAVFPSVAVGWNIANEGFMQNNTAVDVLKLRASYGVAGNEAIDPYLTQTRMAIGPQYVYSGATAIGLRANNLGNAKLKWETTTSLNLAVDFALLKNRINGTVEVYQSKTSDLLLKRQIPMANGYGSIIDNIGKTQNKGLEVSLNTVNIEAGDFKWETSLNFATYRNKIVDLYGDNKDDIGNRWFLGKSTNAIYEYQMVGVWQVGEDPSSQDPGAKPGDLKFADINNDKKITDQDRVYQGTSLPKYTGGITNTFKYKNFNLRVFIQTVQGGLSNNPFFNRADYGGRINQPAEIGYWTIENQSNTRPALSYTNSRGYGYPVSSSYTRIKDITLSYVVPQTFLDRLKIGSLTLYVSGRNVYTFTDWIGWDPEQNFDAATDRNRDNYPNVASYVVGLNLGLR